MEYRVLGKLEVLRDGHPVDLGAFRQRALLALFLTAPGSVLSTDQIIDRLWGDDGGTDKQNALWVYVSGLRKALEPDREKRSEGTILLTRSPGYLVQVDPEAVDSVRFERLIGEGRALAETDPAAASLVLGEALALWRGRAFEEFTYESFAQAEIARLEGLRIEATEARIDADLKRGMSRELVSELEALVRQHPLQERFTGQLMVALYRSGRQADALRSYQLLKSRLGEELGIEPSNQIRRLEEQIVTGDNALSPVGGLGTRGAGTQPGLAVRGYELREKIGEGAFAVAYRAYQPAVGREVAIKVIRPELANNPTFIRRFEAEAQLVARLEHPHIVPLYDYWREPDAAYLVMRLMKGGTLADLLDTSALTADAAARIVDQVGSALATAHRFGVAHRDIKPANILIDDDANAYLCDLGIAVGAGRASEDPSISSTLGAPYASPEQLGGGEATPASDIYSLGVVMAQALSGMAGEVEQIRVALPPPVLGVIDRATDADPARRYDDVDTFAKDLRDALGGSDTALPATAIDVEVDNPYKGLRSFDTADAPQFFGRERLVDRLVARLGESGVRGRFVAVVGPSGSGKSSAVKAGLLPAVRHGALPQSGSWFIVEMTPAPHPFEELEAALLRVAIDPPASLLEQLAGSEHGLQRAVSQILPADGSQLLLVIDQFEELFTQVPSDTAAQFMDMLVNAVTDEHSRIRVVVTLRADFYDRPLRHRGFGELVRQGTEAITPLTPEGLERAIAGPVEPLGVRFEPALVASLVADVVDRAGALPLLQYTLTELFDGRQGNTIMAAAYDELGGVSGALVKRAEALMAGLGDRAHDVTRQVFLRLVTLGEGADDTRRRVIQSELEQLDVDGLVLRGVLDTFGRHRLLSFDRDPVTRGPTVEISHESLLTEWTRLRDWIDGARDDVRNQRRLAEAMGEWAATSRSDQYLLRGGRLDQLHGWASATSLPLSESEQAFLDSSVAERDRVEREEREREQRAVDAERRASQRFRQLAALGVAATIVAGLAVYALVQQRAATSANEERDRLLQATSISAESLEKLENDPELALLLAVQAVRSTADLGFATEEAVDAVHWALYELGVTYDVHTTTPVAVRSGPDGLTGVWVLPPAELVAFAMASTDRHLTDAECLQYVGSGCSDDTTIPVDLPLFRGDEAYGAAPLGPRSLAGTRVVYAGIEELTPLADLRQFTIQTGIDVSLPQQIPPEAIIDTLADGLEADVVSIGHRQIPLLGDLAIDVGAYLDLDDLRSDFTPYLVDHATVSGDGASPAADGAVLGVPTDLDMNGLVYYSPAAFSQAGYEVPGSLDDLLALSRQMVADGHTPWCFGFLSDPSVSSGWPGREMLASLVIRLAGTDSYDDWVHHRIPFNDPAVRNAGGYFHTLVFESGFVRGGSDSITSTRFGVSLQSVMRRTDTGAPNPSCWLYHQADWVVRLVSADVEFGEDLGFFHLPPADAGAVAPVTGDVEYVSPLADRPEVRMFMRQLAGRGFGVRHAEVSALGNYISPNLTFDLSAYGRNSLEPRSAAELSLRTDLARAAQEALAAGRFRLRPSISTSMPLEIGEFTDAGPGAIFAGMVDFADGTRSMDQALADIEAAWVALEADDGGG